MAFSHYETVPNGDDFTEISMYKCDITGEVFAESDGWYGNDRIQISEKGMEYLVEGWIKRHEKTCGLPLILSYLEKRLLSRIKPDRYIPISLRKEVLTKYKHKCTYCGTDKNLGIDHIKPIKLKGLSELDNLQVLCKTCNIKKGAKYNG